MVMLLFLLLSLNGCFFNTFVIEGSGKACMVIYNQHRNLCIYPTMLDCKNHMADFVAQGDSVTCFPIDVIKRHQ